MKKNFTLNITLLGDKKIGKTKLIEDYTSNVSTKQKKEYITFEKKFPNYSMKLNLYEYSEPPEKRKDIANHHCVIIMFDMTSRQSFENILDIWIKFLRQINYVNTIILLGTNNYKDKNALPMTDEKEIGELIDITGINGSFHYIGDKTAQQKNKLIDELIETTYNEVKDKNNNKDCIII